MTFEDYRFSSRVVAGEKPQFFDREVTFFEHFNHFASNGTRGADNGNSKHFLMSRGVWHDSCVSFLSNYCGRSPGRKSGVALD